MGGLTKTADKSCILYDPTAEILLYSPKAGIINSNEHLISCCADIYNTINNLRGFTTREIYCCLLNLLCSATNDTIAKIIKLTTFESIDSAVNVSTLYRNAQFNKHLFMYPIARWFNTMFSNPRFYALVPILIQSGTTMLNQLYSERIQ